MAHIASESGGEISVRRQIEQALGVADHARPVSERLRDAADAAGADLLFVLPSTDGDGTTAMLRSRNGAGDCFLEVRVTERGYAVAEENGITADFLGFARTSADVLERLGADRKIVAPLRRVGLR